MIELAYAVIAVLFVYLGVRLFNKFREISSWKSDEEMSNTQSPRSKPRVILNLEMEDPSDTFESREEPHEKRQTSRGEGG